MTEEISKKKKNTDCELDDLLKGTKLKSLFSLNL